MKLQCLNNQVVISWVNQSRETLEAEVKKAGLSLPKETSEKKQMITMGEVIAFADELLDIHGKEIKLKKGDRILFKDFTTFDLVLDGQAAYTIDAKDIIAIL